MKISLYYSKFILWDITNCYDYSSSSSKDASDATKGHWSYLRYQWKFSNIRPLSNFVWLTISQAKALEADRSIMD